MKNLISNAFSRWIMNGLEGQAIDKTLSDGKIVNLEDIYLPYAITHISCNGGFICFVTKDNPNCVNYLIYRMDANRRLHNNLEKIAKENFESQMYQNVAINSGRLIHICVTDEALYALTTDAKENQRLCVYRWEKTADSLHAEPTVYHIKDVKESDHTNLNMIVSETSRGCMLFLYGFSNSIAYYGRLLIGQSHISLIVAPKLKSVHNHPQFLIAGGYPKQENDQQYLEYWGIEKRSEVFFKYHLPLSQKSEAKIYLQKTINLDDLTTKLSEAKSMSMLHVKVAQSKGKYIVNQMILFATENPNALCTIHSGREGGYVVSPLIVDQAFKSLVSNAMVIYEPMEPVTCLSVLDDHILFYGNDKSGFWRAYRLPYLKEVEKITDYKISSQDVETS